MTDRLARRLALLVLVGGVLLRFARLGADPYYYEWNGYITDEGRWIAHARALRLFGEIGSVGSALHLLLAPLFQAGAFVVFSIADVSLWSARLLSALTGSALLVGFWAAFRRLATPPALLLVLTMLAVEMDLVVLSRLAIPEMAAMALSFAAFLALVRARTRWGLVAGGLLVAAAIGTKATVLPVALIFGVLVVARTPVEALSRARALAAYAVGVLVPAVLAAGAVVAAGASGTISLRILLRVLTGFVRVSDLYAVVGFPFDDSLAPTLALWSLAAWLGCLGGLARRGASEPGDDEVAHFRAACIWAGAFAPLMFALGYFPSRYKVHILVPLAVIIAVGFSWLQRAGLAGLAASLGRCTGVRRMGAALLLSAPTALIVTAALLSLGGSIGLDPGRLRLRYAMILLVLVGMAALVSRALPRVPVVRLLVWLPPVWASAWLVVERLTVAGAPFWPAAAGSGQAPRWTLLLVAIAVASTFAATPTGPRRTGGIAVVAGALLVGVLGLVRLAPGYLDPHYSMRDSSRDLGTLLGGVSGSIRTLGAEALFSDNRLRYRSVFGGQWSSAPPDVLVLAGRMEPSDRLHHEYRLIRQYPIYVSPEFILGEPTWSAAVGQFRRTTVSVYRRAGEGG